MRREEFEEILTEAGRRRFGLGNFAVACILHAGQSMDSTVEDLGNVAFDLVAHRFPQITADPVVEEIVRGMMMNMASQAEVLVRQFTGQGFATAVLEVADAVHPETLPFFQNHGTPLSAGELAQVDQIRAELRDHLKGRGQ